MKYYKHKQTGKIIGVLGSLIDLVDGDGNISVITQIILPEKQLGNGILYHSMKFSDISKNYKRTNKKEAFEMYPDFGQLRHKETVYNRDIKVLAKYYLGELQPLREKGFGYSFNKEDERIKPHREDLFKTVEKDGILAGVKKLKESTDYDLKTCYEIVKTLQRG